MRLDQLRRGTGARIAGVDWTALGAGEGRRLRELGFDEGVPVRALHSGPLGQDPMAIQVGRMTIAMRRTVARAVSIEIEEQA